MYEDWSPSPNIILNASATDFPPHAKKPADAKCTFPTYVQAPENAMSSGKITFSAEQFPSIACHVPDVSRTYPVYENRSALSLNPRLTTSMAPA